MDVDPAAYGDAFADVYDAWYADVSDVEATVAAITTIAVAAAGRDRSQVLELGVGTGRIAIPLACAVDAVHGLDASEAMLELLAAKPDGHTVISHLGDMASPDLSGATRFHVVFVAFNTFFNLETDGRQRACLANVAALLHPAGRWVVEAFVPADAPDGSGEQLHVSDPRPDGQGGAVVTRSWHDPSTQQVFGVHIHTSAADVVVERPWTIRYLHPGQLDDLAAAAGLVLEARWGDWNGGPFDAQGDRHVSVYRLADRHQPT